LVGAGSLNLPLPEANFSERMGRMISADYLSMLRCPEDRTSLALADAALVDRLNQAIAAGRLQNRGGDAVASKLDAALVRADGKVAYPVFEEIPVLLVDEGIWLEQ
jgi:uncharacterized protein YbaR (Trm112 family)